MRRGRRGSTALVVVVLGAFAVLAAVSIATLYVSVAPSGTCAVEVLVEVQAGTTGYYSINATVLRSLSIPLAFSHFATTGPEADPESPYAIQLSMGSSAVALENVSGIPAPSSGDISAYWFNVTGVSNGSGTGVALLQDGGDLASASESSLYNVVRC